MPGKSEEEKIHTFLGLCARARGLVSGETAVTGAVKAGKAKLVILATDASDNSGKLYRDKCASHHIPLLEFGTADALGAAIGKNRRSALAVTDANFAEELKKRVTGLTREL